jgi:hypothetical protein
MLFEVIEPQKANNINLGNFFTWTPILLHITLTNLVRGLFSNLDRRNSPKQPENSFLCCFGAIGHPNELKKILESLQVAGKYVPMSKLEYKPLTKSLGPLLKEK